MGVLGDGPPMIPLDVTLDTPAGEKKYHFEVIESPQLTPTAGRHRRLQRHHRQPRLRRRLDAAARGPIKVKGHTPVQLQDLFAPTDQPTPAAFFVATEVQSAFARIYSNPYELPEIEHIDLRVKPL